MSLDSMIRDQLAHAREVQPTPSESATVQRAVRSAVKPRRARRFSRPAAIVAAVAVAVPTAALAASPAGDALVSFIGLAKSAPVTLDYERGTVIDEQGGVAFTITRNDSDDVCLQLGGSVGICDSTQDDGWAQQLDDNAVVPVGTIPPPVEDRAGPVSLFVLAAPAAERVGVRYETGPATMKEAGQGGAVIAVDGSRAPQEVIARDGSGAELGRSDISDRQFTWCYDADGCPEQSG